MNLHQILLQPTDVLFFRDGRPMSGSLAGHTAAWPLPDVTDHALHAALHRADLEKLTGLALHLHRRGRSGAYSDRQEDRDRKFGALLSAGPFPVLAGTHAAAPECRWFFPRPKDAQVEGAVALTFAPVSSLSSDAHDEPWLGSSLPIPLVYAVANMRPPAKHADPEAWLSAAAFDAYLRRPDFKLESADTKPHFVRDADLADTEHTIGIGIDPESQTQDGENFYSAQYLRLRESYRLGLFVRAMDKVKGDPANRRDLIAALFNDHPQSIIVGGQQRICTAYRSGVAGALPLPMGLHGQDEFKALGNGKIAVKWVLLSPAIWPAIPCRKKDGSSQDPHPGGWLPNWVFVNWDPRTAEATPDVRNGRVLLTAGPGVRKARRTQSLTGGAIGARLVAALVPKPLVVTGWALAAPPEEGQDAAGGAKSTQLAVPAGAVYYFEAERREDAVALANALNWHGDSPGTEIRNRRSTLLGEKGYGLGVCGTWDFYPQRTPNPAQPQ